MKKYRGLLETLEVVEQQAATLRAELHGTLAEQQLQESIAARHRYRVLFEASRDGILVVEKATRTITDANHAVGSLVGLEPRLLVGRTCESLFVKDGAPEIVRELLLGQRDGIDRTIAVLRADGQLRAVEATSTSVRLEGRECVHLVLRDVSERLRLEEERVGLLSALHQSHKLEALGQLAGGVSHDMNNVLSVVLSCARALHEDIHDAEHRADLEQILVAGERGQDLVLQLLAFARKEPERKESFDVVEAVREATNLFARLMPATVELKVDLPASAQYVVGDHSQLVQAVVNLCVNARDAMANTGMLTVGVVTDEKRVTVRVQDTGTGMTDEVKRRAFEPFFTTKARGSGTGLGLSMVYTTVKSHRGDLRLESELGKGTRFTFWLPKEGAEAPSKELSAPAPRKNPRLGRALVIDDDENVGRVLGTSLRAMGFEVDFAQSGDEAVAKMQNGPAPSVAVCDLIMPGLSGTETMKRLRLVDPHLPVIIASGFLESTEGARILSEGATDVLSKPFSNDDFRRVMKRALGSVNRATEIR